MEEVRENKMGTQPIGDLLFKMVPADHDIHARAGTL